MGAQLSIKQRHPRQNVLHHCPWLWHLVVAYLWERHLRFVSAKPLSCLTWKMRVPHGSGVAKEMIAVLSCYVTTDYTP